MFFWHNEIYSPMTGTIFFCLVPKKKLNHHIFPRRAKIISLKDLTRFLLSPPKQKGKPEIDFLSIHAGHHRQSRAEAEIKKPKNKGTMFKLCEMPNAK